MADDVQQRDIQERGNRLYTIESASAAGKFYQVDAANHVCDCMAYVMKRNRAVRDGLGQLGDCKHLTAVAIFEKNAGTVAAKKQQDEEARTAAEFQRIKRKARLQRDLKELREDV